MGCRLFLPLSFWQFRIDEQVSLQYLIIPNLLDSCCAWRIILLLLLALLISFMLSRVLP